mgnify:CR=1 FL=1
MTANTCGKANVPSVTPMTSNAWSKPDAAPFPIQAHHLACAVCTRGGCGTPPCGMKTMQPLLDALWDAPHLMLQFKADLELSRAHFFDIYENRTPERLPADFAARSAEYDERRKDLEMCRILGIYPNTVLPAFHAIGILFARLKSLQGFCHGVTCDTATWPECPHAKSGCYEKIAAGPWPGLRDQTAQGEALAGQGLWALCKPRTRADMATAKRTSAEYIEKEAPRLYIRPNHVLCILCTRAKTEPLIEDNLIELRKRMEANPDIPVVLTEGCCMVCDACNEYHPEEHICFHAHPKNVLRDLNILATLGLQPGAEISARELYRRVYERIPNLKAICGWGDGSSTTPFWGSCGNHSGSAIADAKNSGFLM